MPAARCLCPACPSTTHHRIPRGWELIASDGVHVTLSNGSVARSGALLSAPLPRGLRGEEQNSVQSEKAIVPAATGLYRFACAGRDVVY